MRTFLLTGLLVTLLATLGGCASDLPRSTTTTKTTTEETITQPGK